MRLPPGACATTLCLVVTRQHTRYSTQAQFSYTSLVLTFILVIFLLLTIILIMNLIIASFNYTYSKVSSAAEAELRVSQNSIITAMTAGQRV